MDALQLRDNAKSQLLEIKTIESGVEYLNKMKAIEVWAKAEKKDAELQNLIAEQKLRTQRILGGLLKDSEKANGSRGIGKKVDFPADSPLLSNYGVSHKQSSTFQQIAEIPEDDFEEFIHEKKQAVNNAVAELTTTGAVRLAKSLKEKRDDLRVTSSLNERLEIEHELKDLAKSINESYTLEQRQFLIRFIKI